MKKKTVHILKNSKGSSLIEVITAAAISVIVSGAVMKTNQTGIKGVNNVSTKMNLTMWKNSVLLSQLSNPDTCIKNLTENSYGGYQRENLVKEDGVAFATNQVDLEGTSGDWVLGDPDNPEINPVVFSAFVPDINESIKGRCDLTLTVTRTKNSFGANTRKVNIPINCIASSDLNSIVSCSASTDATANSYWKLVSGDENLIPEHLSSGLTRPVLIGQEDEDAGSDDDITAPFQINNSSEFEYVQDSGVHVSQRILGTKNALAWENAALWEEEDCLYIGHSFAGEEGVELAQKNKICNDKTSVIGGSIFITQNEKVGIGVDVSEDGENYPAQTIGKMFFTQGGATFKSRTDSSNKETLTAAAYPDNPSSVNNQAIGIKGIATIQNPSNANSPHHGYYYGVYGSARHQYDNQTGRTFGVYGEAGGSGYSGGGGYNYGVYGRTLGGYPGASIFGSLGWHLELKEKYAGYFNGQIKVGVQMPNDDTYSEDDVKNFTKINGSNLEIKSIPEDEETEHTNIFQISNASALTIKENIPAQSTALDEQNATLKKDMLTLSTDSRVVNPSKFNYLMELTSNGVAFSETNASTGEVTENTVYEYNKILMEDHDSLLRTNIQAANINLANEDQEVTVASNSIKFIATGVTSPTEITADKVSAPFVYSNDVLLTSDRRLKNNIKPIDSSLEKILKIEGVKFNYNTSKDPTPTYGVIAQDVEKILPDLVNIREGKQFKDQRSVRYIGFIAVLINAVKDLYNEMMVLFDQQDLRLIQVEKENEILKNMIEENAKLQQKQNELIKELQKQVDEINSSKAAK